MLLFGPFAQPLGRGCRADGLAAACVERVRYLSGKTRPGLSQASIAVLIGTFASVVALTGEFIQTGRLSFS
jgi:hypothetical protein